MGRGRDRPVSECFSNGNEYRNRYAWIFEIRDDKIYALREYMDSHYILQQLKML